MKDNFKWKVELIVNGELQFAGEIEAERITKVYNFAVETCPEAWHEGKEE